LTLPAALPFAGAALRAMRTAAGRRALQLTLLVGGLFALALLCEGQAHAADGTPTASAAPAAAGTQDGTAQTAEGAARRFEGTVSNGAGHGSREPMAHRGHPTTSAGHVPHVESPVLRSGGRAASPAAQRDAKPVGRPAPGALAASVAPVASVTGTAPAVGGTVRQAVRPVTATLVRPVGDMVVRPVGELVRTVTDGPAGAPAQWPPLPSLPSPPGLPGLPALPGLPGLPKPPVHTLPAPAGPRQPGGGTERPGAVEQRVTGVYGPRSGVTSAAPRGEYAPLAPHAVQLPHRPRHQAPDGGSGDPAHVFGDQPGADGGTPRHGDGHAVTSNHRAAPRLVPGVTAALTADGTRDRHRDIPEFPG
jgi:hypothetical protein